MTRGLGQGYTKANELTAVVGPEPVAARQVGAAGVDVPAAAAEHTERGGFRYFRIDATWNRVLVEVSAPFPYISHRPQALGLF